MKVYISPSMSKITISANPGFLDPHRIKIAVKYLSFRTLFWTLLFTAFFLPFAFILIALIRLEGWNACRSSDCLYRVRKFGFYPDDVAQVETMQRGASSSGALVGALAASTASRLSTDTRFNAESAPVAKMDHLDSAAAVVRLKGMVEAGEERLRVAKLQRALYRHYASKGIPKGMHCLALRLTTEYALNPEARRPIPPAEQQSMLTDNSKHHFVLITDNVFAASVVVKSAVANSPHAASYVFHIVTDKMSFAAMHAWFTLNPAAPAVLEVLGVHNFEWLKKEKVPVLELIESSDALKRHFFGDEGIDSNSTDSPSLLAAKLAARNPKYISIMNHLRMYLPQVLPNLDKVVFLDDDVVVQRDLTPLWEIPLNGKVMGAVETCRGVDQKVMSKKFKSYLNFSDPLIANNFEPEKCAWAYGMNIFDLARWRDSDITEVYHYWQRQNIKANLSLWRLGTLPPSLIAFNHHMEPIDPSWHMLGLGYQQESNMEAIQKAAVIHYNGAAKPWLELAIPELRPFWSKYVNYSNEFMRQCNIFDF